LEGRLLHFVATERASAGVTFLSIGLFCPLAYQMVNFDTKNSNLGTALEWKMLVHFLAFGNILVWPIWYM
jgi:hypothetical protein